MDLNDGLDGDISGFLKVIWEKDLAMDSPVPWYLPLDTSRFSLTSFRLTAVGRFLTRTLVINISVRAGHG